MKLPIRGNYHHRSWELRQGMGNWIRKGGDPQQTHSHLVCFLMNFPPSQLNLIVDLRRVGLGKKSRELHNNW